MVVVGAVGGGEVGHPTGDKAGDEVSTAMAA